MPWNRPDVLAALAAQRSAEESPSDEEAEEEEGGEQAAEKVKDEWEVNGHVHEESQGPQGGTKLWLALTFVDAGSKSRIHIGVNQFRTGLHLHAGQNVKGTFELRSPYKRYLRNIGDSNSRNVYVGNLDEIVTGDVTRKKFAHPT